MVKIFNNTESCYWINLFQIVDQVQTSSKVSEDHSYGNEHAGDTE